MPAAKTPKVDPRVTKRKVTMRSAILAEDGVHIHEASDYVRPDVLDAYVTDARRRWQNVTVSDGPDAGPGGFDGSTYIPAGVEVARPDGTTEWHAFPHPDAHTFYPATDCTDCTHAPVVNGVPARLVREA